MPTLFSSLPEEIPVDITLLAYQLHCQNTQSLTIEIPDSTLLLIEQIDDLFHIKDKGIIICRRKLKMNPSYFYVVR